MANYTAADVKKLREETDAPMMECKAALDEADGAFARAKEILREKGKAAAAKLTVAKPAIVMPAIVMPAVAKPAVANLPPKKPLGEKAGGSASPRAALTEGAKAPAFSLPRDGGATVSLNDYAGQLAADIDSRPASAIRQATATRIT